MEPCLAAAGPPRDLGLVGRTFGQYRILSLIQRGGMGEIYLAELAPQCVKVVLKRLQEAHTFDERYVEMFRNEALVMSELEHPNIVKVLGVPSIEDRQCLVLEFVRGRNLQQVLRRLREVGRLLPPALAVHVMRKVLLGLHEAHQARFPDGRSLELVHRDVKPGNILVSFAGDVKITDFGIAKSALQNRLTTAGVVKGTVRYLAPEQIRSERITLRADIFSCASVLVEMLTDQPLYDRGPVAATLMAILNDDRAPIVDLLPFRAPDLAKVIERALRTRPEERFQSALEFSQALGVASRTLGAAMGGDALGGLLRQLFQGASELVEDRISAEDVTYLMANENPSSGARSVAAARGSAPLDAEAFRRGPPPLPKEYLEAKERADALLNAEVIFDDPVEMDEKDEEVALAVHDLGAGLDELDLDKLDLDDLDLDEDETGLPAEPELSPVSTVHEPALPLPAASPLGPSPLRSSDALSFVAVDAARASTERRDGTRLRVYLLAGCLLGVVLTYAVLALTRF